MSDENGQQNQADRLRIGPAFRPVQEVAGPLRHARIRRPRSRQL